MCEAVIKHNAHLGVALDGDADRVVMCDEKGNLIDGDQIMALIATSWQQQGLLCSDKVVGTVMSNLGLEKYLSTKGLDLIRLRAQYKSKPIKTKNYYIKQCYVSFIWRYH